MLRQKGDTEENETNSFYNNIDNFRIHQYIKFLNNLEIQNILFNVFYYNN